MSTNTHPPFEPEEMCTRFLFPFFFDRNSVAEARRALEASTLPDREGVARNVWESRCLDLAERPQDGDHPHHLYREEMLGNVLAYLFGANGAAAGGGSDGAHAAVHGCTYLRLSGAFVSRWFNKPDVTLRKGLAVPVRLEAPAQAELFLSSHGAGVLSLAFKPKLSHLDPATALAFNYRLSQLREATAAEFTVSLPPPEVAHAGQPARTVSQPASSAIGERFGRAGEAAVLRELIEGELLRPLAPLGYRRAQEQLSVYTVVRFGVGVDFEDRSTRDALAPFLSALAQVSEPTHACSPSDLPLVPNVILNRCHWAAACALGSAHVVADQAEDVAFNSARVPRVVLKYFVPFLTAFAQRLALLRASSEACGLVMSGRDGYDTVKSLRGDLLRFAVNGHFTEVSSRESVHRYYRLCQEGLGVRDLLEDARRALSDLEAKHATETQLQMARETKAMQEGMTSNLDVMKENLDTVRKIQEKVEWIECVIVGIYLSEVAHIVLDYLKEGWARAKPEPYELPAVYGIAVIVGAWALGFGVMALVLKPWKHDHH